jgi:hypothetical protein
MHWGIQTNLSTSEAEKIIPACRKLGIPFTELTIIPFSFQLPEMPTDIPTLFYVSVGFINRVWKSQRWKPGIIFNENFDYRHWGPAWGEHCLNANAKICTLEELNQQSHSEDKLFFLRPCADDKAFTGCVLPFGEISTWMDNILGASPEFKNTLIAVSEPLGITNEWRLYIVNNKVSSGSLYRHNFQSVRSPNVPSEVIDFAEKMTAQWSPAPLFTLDVAQSGDSLYVNEMGCLHSCGFYASDVFKILSDINDYFQNASSSLH